ncbi:MULTISPECIES: hypothetical protein [Microbacterium]|uniref:Uncharacterized protein n=1 Tax=Microbacterium wangchenii TaxID=2541726 RepID=A0ABX5SRL9_9MICO|nr:MULTISPECIES: hypothetical protein [Microbacterium]MCK6068244.1 hypothetical protein [Microbacterium sp. EYE_512]QBR87529.1 hypothetical protein E4K62_01755 [Microbacterium wangchenii]TXK15797.1 hypothetical protein FVP99_09855 [Microbacterium wangchenii]
MSHAASLRSEPQPRPRRSGLPIVAIIALAALRVPGPVLEDLGILEAGQWTSLLLSWAPVALWIAVVVIRPVARPFLTVLAIGATSGVLLVIAYQLLWNQLFEDDPASVGGGGMPIRLVAILGGLITGVVAGAVGGLIAWAVRAVVNRRAGVT